MGTWLAMRNGSELFVYSLSFAEDEQGSNPCLHTNDERYENVDYMLRHYLHLSFYLRIFLQGS